MRRVTLSVSIRLDNDPGRVHHMAVMACFPDADALRSPYMVIFAGPGGGYSKEYYDLQLPDAESYSQAEHHTRAGLALIAFDHVGVGLTRTDGDAAVSRETAAAVNDALIRELSQRIAAGTIAPAIEALPGAYRILMGHSMGACLGVIQQSKHRTCDALAVLGFSAIQAIVPDPPFGGQPPATRSTTRRGRTNYAGLSGDDARHTEKALAHAFFWEDVPASTVERDFGGGYPLRQSCPPWGSSRLPGYSRGMTDAGIIAAQAARVAVPVFLGFGARDVSANPWAEPCAYSQSTDISLYVVPRMAHMHNFASTRQQFWNRIVNWARLQAERAT